MRRTQPQLLYSLSRPSPPTPPQAALFHTRRWRHTPDRQQPVPPHGRPGRLAAAARGAAAQADLDGCSGAGTLPYGLTCCASYLRCMRARAVEGQKASLCLCTACSSAVCVMLLLLPLANLIVCVCLLNSNVRSTLAGRMGRTTGGRSPSTAPRCGPGKPSRTATHSFLGWALRFLWVPASPASSLCPAC